MFQIKDFTSIVAGMVNYARVVTGRLTDYNVGAIGRTLMEAPAAEIDELYQQARIGLMEAIPVSVYRSFNFPRLDATTAQGGIVLDFAPQPAPILIPAGSRFVTPTQAGYRTLADFTLGAGATQAVPVVEAEVTGPAGNLPQGIALSSIASLPGLLSAEVGAAGISGGRPEETDPERRFRFNEFIRTLSRGTPAALEYGLSLAQVPRPTGGVERVVSAKVEEMYLTDPNNPTGWVRCHISAGAAAPSSALIARAIEVLHGYLDAAGKKVAGWKGAGVRTDVLAAQETPATFVCRVTPAEGYSPDEAEAATTAILQDYAIGLPVGEQLLLAEAVARIMALAEVGNVRIPTPAADLDPGTYGKITFGGATYL